eukprot:363478-Lingulodinium_polyedra.AAC.1
MSLFMTKNVAKDMDYINGMQCTVEDWVHHGGRVPGSLRVITATGRRVSITLRADDNLNGIEYYPVRP